MLADNLYPVGASLHSRKRIKTKDEGQEEDLIASASHLLSHRPWTSAMVRDLG